jgi:serine O-acetyltransferase
MNKFSADIARYRANGDVGKDMWLNPAFWAIALCRLRAWVTDAKPVWPIAFPVKVFCFFGGKFCEIFMEMCISPSASIGGGLYIGHIGGVHISQYAVIGENCDIAHRVTIGVSAMGRPGAPVIGDNVYIGPGATVIGKIKIGNGAKIAANTLVLDNVPDGATVVGVPGRILLAPREVVEPPAVIAKPRVASAMPPAVAAKQRLHLAREKQAK